MDTPLTLEQVAEKFKNWRASRTKREKIPDNLLAEGVPSVKLRNL